VTGYDPDDISVKVSNGVVKVSGKHVCHCDENCITREFSRSFSLPAGTEPNSLHATMDIDGNIRIVGKKTRHHSDWSHDLNLAVQGVGIPQSTRPSVDELKSCGKGGIKLNKINQRTGKVHIDEEYKYSEEREPVADPLDEDFDDSYVEIEEL